MGVDMLKIVLVADANILKLRMESSFRNHGLNVDEVKRVEKISSYSNTDDASLYIVDLDSHSSSVSMIEKIKAKDGKPVIALSRNARVSLLKKAVVAGSDDFIIMPYADVTLVYKVQKLLGLASDNDHSPNNYLPVDVDSEDVTEVILRWSKKIEINIPDIDNEHKSIIENYEKLYHLMHEGKGHKYYSELIEGLNDYVHTHFDHEEVLHEETKYPLADEHRDIHEAFKASVRKIAEEGNIEDVSNMDLIKISLFIKNWWVHHILIEDMKFAKFLNKNE